MYRFNCIKETIERSEPKIEITDISLNHKDRKFFSIQYQDFQDIIQVFYQAKGEYYTEGVVYDDSLRNVFTLDKIKKLENTIKANCFYN